MRMKIVFFIMMTGENRKTILRSRLFLRAGLLWGILGSNRGSRTVKRTMTVPQRAIAGTGRSPGAITGRGGFFHGNYHA